MERKRSAHQSSPRSPTTSRADAVFAHQHRQGKRAVSKPRLSALFSERASSHRKRVSQHRAPNEALAA
eukprot:1883624-Rhodomonas_salina.4